MAMQYINYIKAKTPWVASKKNDPVLSEDDEKFLQHITMAENPAPLGIAKHGGDAQVALMNGAQDIPLPPGTPGELVEEPLGLIDVAETEKPKSKTWNWLRRDSRDTNKETTAAGLSDIAAGLKDSQTSLSPEDAEAKREEEEMTMMLDRLNLAAVNNRVFSISDETSELLHKFNQVLKDLMNGVPTAYNDLESLLTNGDQQIQKTYNSLPAFLQKLIEKLPEAMTKGIAPEMMAAAASRASGYGINLEKAGKAAGKFAKPPSLHDLLGKPGAITAMLKSIMQFLRTRFPAFAGMNVLWSMALFILLFVFWYCYKRGKETRLEKERVLTEEEVKSLEKEWTASQVESGLNEQFTRPTTTTAPPGASMEQVRAGVLEADAAKIAAASQRPASSGTGTPVGKAE